MDERKRPRISPKAGALYRCKEGLSDPEIWATKARRGWQGAVHGEVEVRLWNAGCERYLCDATYRWLLAVLRSPVSLPAYAQRWALFAVPLGSLQAVLGVTVRAVEDFLFRHEGRVAPRTVSAYLQVVRSFYGWAEDEGLVEASPIRQRFCRRWRFDPQRVEKADGSRQALTLAEARRVATWCLREAEPEAGVSVLLQCVAGLRSAEVAAAERSDLARAVLEAGELWTLTVRGKGKRSRKIPLEPVVVAALERFDHSHRRTGSRGPLLRAPGGGHYTTRQVQRWAKAAARVAGREREISSHDLRASAATLLIEAGAQLREVQAYLGHASLMTTDTIYVRRGRALSVTTGITTDSQ